jgi:hypothetical protein
MSGDEEGVGIRLNEVKVRYEVERDQRSGKMSATNLQAA